VGRAHVANRQGRVPEEPALCGWKGQRNGRTWVPQGTRIGWVAGRDLFLALAASSQVVQQLGAEQVFLSTGPVLKVPLHDLHAQPPDAMASNGRIETLEEVERRHILETLHTTDWVVGGPKGAAVMLGLMRSTLQVRMEKLGIRRSRAAQ
jgi:transcriptional regulator with GAF, ATPase, and Fis domain